MGQPTYDLATADHDYPLWIGPPARHILICTHPRSGSTLLGEALHFAGGLGCPLEYFHVGFRPSFAQRWCAPDIGSYTKAVRRHRTDPGGVMSVKLFWRDIEELAQEIDPVRFPAAAFLTPHQMDEEIYRQLAALLTMLFPNMALVHLFRRDRVRQAVSAVVATSTGQWRDLQGAQNGPVAPLTAFDSEKIERMIGYSDHCNGHWRNLFNALGRAPHDITYEALVGDYAQSIASLLRALGSDAAPSPARMHKQADVQSEAMVLRYLRERAVPTPVVNA